jgi:RNA polymerase sigma-70 factor (ECF subfamily)
MARDDHSTQIQRCIDRLRAGDPTARDELLAHAVSRLTRLTRKMLRDFPSVQRWEETDDVFQNAALRLCRALHEVQPETVADFFRLAAVQIRRALLDLARIYSGAHGLGAHHASNDRPGKARSSRSNPPDTTRDPNRLAAWTEFHREAELLPVEERAVFDLLFYQGLTQAEAAAVLGVAEITIKRRWRAVRMRLVQALGDRLPGL